MVAHLFLLSESLQYNGTDTDEEVLKKFAAFANDLKYISEYKEENIILVDNRIFDIQVGKDGDIYQFINQLEKDTKRLLQSILYNTSKSVELTVEEITALCKDHNENSCSALIALNDIDYIDSTIIYDKQDWFKFRRSFLGIYPKDARFFIDECKKYYIDFFFHENNKNSVKPILDDFSGKIIFHLSALHDLFPKIKDEGHYNHAELLKKFSIAANLDKHASLEGGGKFRKDLKFDFDKVEPDGSISKESLVCEPHMKLCYNDANDGAYYDHRIYFHFGNPKIHGGKILIAHIGEHL